MKNFILTVLLYIPSIAFSQNNITYINASFNGMHCRGDRGICSAESVQNKNQANGFIAYLKDGAKVLKLFKKNVSLDKIATPTLKDNTNDYSLKFVISEEKTFVNKYSENASLKNNKIIFKKGSYPIEITKEFYVITLK